MSDAAEARCSCWRRQAIAEIFRVLKPGGTALIADLWHTPEYQQYFAAQPGVAVEHRPLGWRFLVQPPGGDEPGDSAAALGL